MTLSQGKDMVEAGRRALDEGIYEEAFILFQQEASIVITVASWSPLVKYAEHACAK